MNTLNKLWIMNIYDKLIIIEVNIVSVVHSPLNYLINLISPIQKSSMQLYSYTFDLIWCFCSMFKCKCFGGTVRNDQHTVKITHVYRIWGTFSSKHWKKLNNYLFNTLNQMAEIISPNSCPDVFYRTNAIRFG